MANFKHNVTELEIKGLIGICKNQYHNAGFYVENKAEIVGEYQWSFAANPFDNARTFGGVAGSLARKGLAKATNNGDEASICITEEGWEALQERGLIPSKNAEAAPVEVVKEQAEPEVHITELETEGLIHICTSEYHNDAFIIDNMSEIVGHWIWSFSANNFPNERTFSGVVSSLVKKGLAKISSMDNMDIICITEKGWKALLKDGKIPAGKIPPAPVPALVEMKEFLVPCVIMFIDSKGDTIYETRQTEFPLPRKGEQVLVPSNKGVSVVSSVDFVVNDYITGSIRIHLSS